MDRKFPREPIKLDPGPMLELNLENSNHQSSSYSSEIPLLPGEKIDPDVNGREVSFICPYSGEIPGLLYVTNYKLYFKPTNNVKPRLVHLPLCTISKIEKFGGVKSKGENAYGIYITCKDIRTLRFAHNTENHSRRDVYEKLRQYAFPLSHSPSNKLFCFEAKMQYQVDGWSVYEPLLEFKRLKVPNESWRITKINDKYRLCDTYPSILAVPKAASDEQLQSVAAFRSRGRLPVLSWLHPETQASITRCSQPLTGLSGHRSVDDEKYIETIMDANAQSHKIFIMDARPQTNALANKTRGGGLENERFYNAEIQFLDISSIHVMRESLRKLTELCYSANVDFTKFYDDLEATQWLSHVRYILSGAVRVVDKIEYQKSSVVVHCSDGWDRTAQLTSLSMLMLDPYYRTLIGFEVLIQKEWLSFGHKFAQRIGHGEDKPSDDNRSPVFLQWLDCVWQLTIQFPTAFEFNDFLLITLADCVYSCLFGTFLCNTESQRKMEDITHKTHSVWSMVNTYRTEFLNPLYSMAPNQSMISVATAQPRDYVIIPRCSAPFIQLWTSYYCRYNTRISPLSIEEIRIRNKELMAMRAEIEKKVEGLQKQLQNKYSSKSGAIGAGGGNSQTNNSNVPPNMSNSSANVTSPNNNSVSSNI
ncbi:Myotubularin- protein 2 [Blomia tropicalis]|nr:Myotubularin- protein 2 [Blomia tropicalis]